VRDPGGAVAAHIDALECSENWTVPIGVIVVYEAPHCLSFGLRAMQHHTAQLGRVYYAALTVVQIAKRSTIVLDFNFLSLRSGPGNFQTSPASCLSFGKVQRFRPAQATASYLKLSPFVFERLLLIIIDVLDFFRVKKSLLTISCPRSTDQSHSISLRGNFIIYAPAKMIWSVMLSILRLWRLALSG